MRLSFDLMPSRDTQILCVSIVNPKPGSDAKGLMAVGSHSIVVQASDATGNGSAQSIQVTKQSELKAV